MGYPPDQTISEAEMTRARQSLEMERLRAAAEDFNRQRQEAQTHVRLLTAERDSMRQALVAIAIIVEVDFEGPRQAIVDAVSALETRWEAAQVRVALARGTAAAFKAERDRLRAVLETIDKGANDPQGLAYAALRAEPGAAVPSAEELKVRVAELTTERDAAEKQCAEAERELNATWLALEEKPENVVWLADEIEKLGPAGGRALRDPQARRILAALRDRVTALAAARAGEGPTFAKLREALLAALDEIDSYGPRPGWADRARDLLR